MKIVFKQIVHNTAAYLQVVKLRDKILRKPLNLKFTKAQLAAENNQLHFAGYLNNEPICTFIFIKKNAENLKMRQVAVAAKHQKKGVGLQMNLFAETWAKQNNFNRIFCHARKVAVPFYLKSGYKIFDEEFEEVGIPHFKMEKKI